MKKILREILYKLPLGTRLYDYSALFLKPEFVGWGLATIRTTPWSNLENSDLSRGFEQAYNALLAAIENDDFTLLQGRARNIPAQRTMETLKWRHYMVYWSVRYVCETNKLEKINLVELGVFDGLTASFAASSAKDQAATIFLYDSWGAMSAEWLETSEKEMAGAYEENSEKIARANLQRITTDIVYNRGFIPESFASAINPENCHWLHIDLNSGNATKAALQFFHDRITPGGVILFDDYGARQFVHTKETVDLFFKHRNGILLPLPTGQAMYFKLS